MASKKKASAKKATKKASAKKADADSSEEEKPAAPPKPKKGAALVAQKLIEDPDNLSSAVAQLGVQMTDKKTTPATQAARVLHELVREKPAAVVPLVEKFARGITSSNKRVVQVCADALPAIAKIQPARVAKHLDTILLDSFEDANDDGKDGLVRTFAGLCSASVAYQKRLEPVLTVALTGADGKTLLRWSRIVLPALKGEPHARAREVVQTRLYRIPSSHAKEIAEFLGIRLRVRYH